MARIHDTWADTDTPLALELYYSGAWHDITGYLSEDGWTITRGDPAELSCTLSNADGRFSPRHPDSPLFGLIGRNTPIRASVVFNSVTYIRFVGEVSAWPTRWTRKGTSYVPITAAGPRRRLGRGVEALRSAYYRGCTNPSRPVENLVGYWPGEDGTDATSLESGLPGGRPGTIVGSPSLASATSFACSSPMITLTTGAKLAMYLTPPGTSDSYQTRLLMSVPDTIAANARLLICGMSGGDIARITVHVTTAGEMYFTAEDASLATLYTSATYGFNLAGADVRIQVSWHADGSDTVVMVATLVPGSGGGYFAETVTGYTCGDQSGLVIAPDGDLDQWGVGHFTIQSDEESIYSLADLLAAYSGTYSAVRETAADRITRLCDEHDVTADVTDPGTSVIMGPQHPRELLTLLKEAEAADGGLLFDARDSLAIAYRTRYSLYTQDPALELDYTDNLLSPFEPVDDDALTRNRVTITREDGGHYTAEQTTGPMSTQAPPDGVGIYRNEHTLSLNNDVQCRPLAHHHLALGTIDAPRWPAIGLDLAHPTLTADTDLTAAALGVDIGDRITVDTLPDWLPPEFVDALVIEYSERVTVKRYSIIYRCRPYDPYRIHEIGTDRVASVGTTLATPLPTGHVVFAGDQCRSAAAIQQTDDLDVRVRVSLDDWTPAAQQVVIARYDNADGANERSWSLDVVATTGALHCYLSTDGSSYTNYTSTAATGFAAGTVHWIRFVYRSATGDVEFHTCADGYTWSQLGTTVAGAASGGLYDADADLQLGARSGISVTSDMAGVVYVVQVLDGVDGDPLAATDPTTWTDGYDGAGTGSTATTETTGSVVTVYTLDTPDGWGHNDGDYVVTTDGETATVTAVSGTPPAQQLTLTRSENGVIKGHDVGASIQLHRPARFGLY
jgi:hypothetical protein